MGLRFLSAGDSHGEALVGIIEGMPAGVRVSIAALQHELKRRRKSYGRSSRQMIEQDEVSVISGLWDNRTTGAPLAILIPNRGRVVQGKPGGAMGTIPRPGHADLPGVLKYGLKNIPPVSERASARSTTMRVAIGAVAKLALKEFGIDSIGRVLAIGDVDAPRQPGNLNTLRKRVQTSPVFCADKSAAAAMIDAIKAAKEAGDSIGGAVEVIATGVPPGLGSHVEWDRKLDAQLAAAMMSIQSVKAVEIGDGIESARAKGVDAHDAMEVRDGHVVRMSNHAGGFEGSMTNGEPVVVRAFAKPIPTAQRRARTFNLRNLRATDSPYVRSDVCVIPALSVIAENVVAWELCRALFEKFGGDHIDDTKAALTHYRSRIDQRFAK